MTHRPKSFAESAREASQAIRRLGETIHDATNTIVSLAVLKNMSRKDRK